MLAFTASITYMVASGSFLQVLANFLNSLIQSVIIVNQQPVHSGFMDKQNARCSAACRWFFLLRTDKRLSYVRSIFILESEEQENSCT